MNIVRLGPCLLAVVLLVPTALAAPDLTARTLALDGTSEIAGDSAALFAIADEAGFVWDATAASATLTREYADFVATAGPNDASYGFAEYSQWRSESIDLTEVTLVSAGVEHGGALLAESGTMQTEANGLVSIASVTDPLLTHRPQDVATVDTEEEANGYIEERLAGDYLNVTATDGDITLVGDLDLVLYGPAYTLGSREEQGLRQTGIYETSRTLVLVQGTQERQRIHLVDAVLHLRSPTPVSLFTQYPEIHFVGTLTATEAEGALALAGDTIAPVDRALQWTGETDLLLTPAPGFVRAAAPDPVLATSGAIVAQGPPVALLGGALALLAAAALAALVLARRRPRAEDLDAALVAMTERRWSDALPRLTRLARARPTDASLQIDRALCLEQTGRFADAAKAFEAALRAAPAHAEAHFYYARTLAKMRQAEAARVHLEAALEHDPRLVDLARRESVLRGL